MRGGAPSEAERGQAVLSLGILAFRWVSLVWMVVLALTAGELRRPALAWTTIAALAAGRGADGGQPTPGLARAGGRPGLAAEETIRARERAARLAERESLARQIALADPARPRRRRGPAGAASLRAALEALAGAERSLPVPWGRPAPSGCWQARRGAGRGRPPGARQRDGRGFDYERRLLADGKIGLAKSVKGRVEVVAEAADGGDAIERAREAIPELVLMDLNLPRVPGVEAIRPIVEESPHVKVLVRSASAEEADVLEAVKVGASGHLLKSATPTELVDAVVRVRRGAGLLPDAGRPRPVLIGEGW
jgi:CheY-like chemotaxis protein